MGYSIICIRQGTVEIRGEMKGKLPWRIGRSSSQATQPALCNLYDADENQVGTMETKALAEQVVQAMNAWKRIIENSSQVNFDATGE